MNQLRFERRCVNERVVDCSLQLRFHLVLPGVHVAPVFTGFKIQNQQVVGRNSVEDGVERGLQCSGSTTMRRSKRRRVFRRTCCCCAWWFRGRPTEKLGKWWTLDDAFPPMKGIQKGPPASPVRTRTTDFSCLMLSLEHDLRIGLSNPARGLTPRCWCPGGPSTSTSHPQHRQQPHVGEQHDGGRPSGAVNPEIGNRVEHRREKTERVGGDVEQEMRGTTESTARRPSSAADRSDACSAN